MLYYRIFLFLLLSLFFIPSLVWASQTPPSAQNYAPNLWFSLGEEYYPVNPLDFYFENGQEINGQKAVKKYNQLHLKEKIKNMVVFYHILDYGDEWVYQYWFFYVFNDSVGVVKNKHYGDWEAIYVYVDKNTQKVNKVIGTAHQRRFFDTELNYPTTNHIWSYIGNGSHANCVDGTGEGYCVFLKWRIGEKWDKNGLKIKHNQYNLVEINAYFIKQFNQLKSLAKSSALGINLLEFSDIIDKQIYLPVGGNPPIHAWEQSSFYNPDELRPISFQLAKEYVSDQYNQIKQTGSQIAGFLNSLLSKATQTLDKINPYYSVGLESGILSQLAPGQISLGESSFGQYSNLDQELVSQKGGQKTESIIGSADSLAQEQKKVVQEPVISPQLDAYPKSEVKEKSSKKPETPVKKEDNQEKDDQELPSQETPFQSNLLPPGAGCAPLPQDSQEEKSKKQKKSQSSGPGSENKDEDLDDQEDNQDKEGKQNEPEPEPEMPEKIIDFSVISGDQRGGIDLTWIRPNQQLQITGYLIKYTTSTLQEFEWDKALLLEQAVLPAGAGEEESLNAANLTPGQEYCFAIKSADEFGKESEMSDPVCAQASLAADNVVISELQLDKNEFIELYNPTEQAIDMTDWHLSYYSAGRDWDDDPWRNKQFPEGAIIPAKGYYLVDLNSNLEATNYLSADWSVYKSSFVKSSQGAIGIFSGNPAGKENPRDFKIDILGWGNAKLCEGNCANPSEQNRSLRRNELNLDMNDNSVEFSQSEWPTLQNSAGDKISLISQNLEFNTQIVWSSQDGDFILESNADESPTLNQGAVLTIKSGVKIKGANPNYPVLIIKGLLQVQGSSTAPVLFQGFSQGLENKWSGIVFDQAQGQSVINNAHFILGNSQFANLHLIESNLRISNSVFVGAPLSGIFAQDSELEVENSSFRGIGSIGIKSQGGNLGVSGCVFDRIGDMGLVLTNQAVAQINNNQFINSAWPVYLESSYPRFIGNQAKNNDTDGIIISDESRFVQDWVWDSNLPYILRSNKGKSHHPTVATNTSLIIRPGTIVQAKSELYTALLVEGELVALGASESPIIFSPIGEEWQGIRFSAGSIGLMDYIEFKQSNESILEIDPNAQVDLGENISYTFKDTP